MPGDLHFFNSPVLGLKKMKRRRKSMKVGVIGSGAISDIYLKNMIEKFDNLDVVCIASKHFEHA